MNGAPLITRSCVGGRRWHGLDYEGFGRIIRQAVAEGKIIPGPPMVLESIRQQKPQRFGKKICVLCKKEYQAGSYHVKTCSEKCRNILRSESAMNRAQRDKEMRGPVVVKLCEVCGQKPTSNRRSRTCGETCRNILIQRVKKNENTVRN
jgi:predicted nucleic acid-binding Zn ribbon protein